LGFDLILRITFPVYFFMQRLSIPFGTTAIGVVGGFEVIFLLAIADLDHFKNSD